LPLASFAVATSDAVWPTISALAVGVTATVATGRGLTGSDGSEESEQGDCHRNDRRVHQDMRHLEVLYGA
jgi:hypothetical protein